MVWVLVKIFFINTFDDFYCKSFKKENLIFLLKEPFQSKSVDLPVYPEIILFKSDI